MNYHSELKSKGIQPELSLFRDHWRKSLNGKMHYFRHPQNKAGYQAALQEMYLLKAQLNGKRKNIEVYNLHIDLFSQVLKYWDAFGTPITERKLKRQAESFIAYVSGLMFQPVLPDTIAVGSVLQDETGNLLPSGWAKSDNEFKNEFASGQYTLLGSIKYRLPDKWLDRLSKMAPQEQDKKPQTIQYWYDAYFADMNLKHEQGKVTDSTHDDRPYALASFRKYIDLQAHVTTLGNDTLDKYDQHLQINKTIKRRSKISYMKTAKMFVRWCKLETDCDLKEAPLLEKKYTYVEPDGIGRTRQVKKTWLWSEKDMNNALLMPQPYKCYVLLFLNCGFRHMDLSYLQNVDIDSENQRIVIQRQKLNKLETAPVVSYRLWDATWESLQDCKRTTGKLVFGSVHDSLKSWWKDNRHKYGLGGKRLDYIRKTGSTIIKTDGLSDMYLGECLTTTTRISYNFSDGEICPDLDRAIQRLGFHFGLAPEPAKTIEVTPEVLAALRKMGVNV